MRRKVFIYLFSALLLAAVFIGIPKITSFQYNPLGALIAGFFPSWQKNQPPIPSEEIPESSFVQEENANPGAGRDDDVLVEKIDDLEDQIDVLSQRISEMEKQLQLFNEQISMAQEDEENVEEDLEEDELTEEEVGQDVGQEPCEKIQGVQPAKNKIIFNEIAWMGTSASSSAEWIELKNISGESLDLSGWQILDKEEQTKIFFSAEGKISNGGLFLLERTNDDVIPGIKADKIYTGILSNENEALYLFDGNCQLQDEVTAGPDWPAGDNSSKRTMERKSNFAWQTSFNPGGTPKAENSSGYVVVVPPSGGGGGGGTPPPVVYPKILITEVRISPLAERFVELYNPNSEAVNLTDWYIQRKTESGNIESLVSSTRFEGKNLNPLDYFLIVHSSSTLATDPDILLDITLTKNNTLLLKNPKREIADEINWGDVSEGFSYGRIWDDLVNNYSDNFEILDPTPKEKNKPKTNQPPIASFTFSPENPFIDEEIIFDAASSTDDGQIISYIWDFGDDNSITIDQATTTHSYATSTDFTIGLQVIDNEGAVSALATSTIFVAETGAPFSELDVVINEIAWMGTKASANDEWIEVYNNTTSTIDITGWRLVSSDRGPNINFSTSSIPANDYFLLERTDDTTISDISADLIYTGVLGNNPDCEVLSLYDQNDNLIDQTICIEGNWPAGKNEEDENGEWLRVSMERIDSNALGSDSANWANNNLITRNGLDAGSPPNNINGTPRAQNSVYQ